MSSRLNKVMQCGASAVAFGRLCILEAGRLISVVDDKWSELLINNKTSASLRFGASTFAIRYVLLFSDHLDACSVLILSFAIEQWCHCLDQHFSKGRYITSSSKKVHCALFCEVRCSSPSLRLAPHNTNLSQSLQFWHYKTIICCISRRKL